MNRRDLLAASAAVAGAALTAQLQRRKYTRDLRPPRSRVAVLSADKYSDKLDHLVYDGIRLFDLDVRGKSVLLKPNLVEYIPGKPVNTDAQLIGAAAETFLRLGAASVTVAEGPGHHRDTELLLHRSAVASPLAIDLSHIIRNCSAGFPVSVRRWGANNPETGGVSVAAISTRFWRIRSASTIN